MKSMINTLEKVAISVRSLNLLNQLLKENPKLEQIMHKANNKSEALVGISNWAMSYLKSHPIALRYFNGKDSGRNEFEGLTWRDYAAIRLMDYSVNSGRRFSDLNIRSEEVGTNPFKFIWMAVKNGTGGATEDFFEDMLHLFRQFSGKTEKSIPTKAEIESWMKRHPSGLDPKIIKIREKNRDRIINILIQKIDQREIKSKSFNFKEGFSDEQKYLKMLEWWNNKNFHLRFAIRSPKFLNELLSYSLDPTTMDLLNDAQEAGIPFFINPYYLTLLNVSEPSFAPGADIVIRDYIIYSKELIEEFGHLVAWEREDIVKPGKPNIAGWMLPSAHNVHRRYPEVAILIPDTVGRACGGLCVSCQRMYDFQAGNLNFNLDKLKPKEVWPQKLGRLMEYFEEDTQLRDILITGGDALMSSDISLKNILEQVFQMADRKRKTNLNLPDGKKYAEMQRIRLGTRLPAYLPQRVTLELLEILKNFKVRASKIGIKQFVIQTHFQTPMEITPASKKAVSMLLSAGWIVTNQLVFTAATSRRGHTAKLRKVLNDIGVITYYTFSVKGYMENYHNFATNARAVQEQSEEKYIGRVPKEFYNRIKNIPSDAAHSVRNIQKIREEAEIPFMATDRNVLNLPGIGKSLTFRTIGITRHGRRILEFDHDTTRNHSPIVEGMGKIVVIECKSIAQYMRQLENMGEDAEEYESVYGYSIGESEPINPVFQYPEFPFELTKEVSNFKMEVEDEEEEEDYTF